MTSQVHMAELAIPGGLLYTRDHCWIRHEGTMVRVGVTDIAGQALGKVVFVQLPELGSAVDPRVAYGWIENLKAGADLFPPVRGIVHERNERLVYEPGAITEDPYGEGWLCVITPAEPPSSAGLYTAAQYTELVAGRS